MLPFNHMTLYTSLFNNLMQVNLSEVQVVLKKLDQLDLQGHVLPQSLSHDQVR